MRAAFEFRANPVITYVGILVFFFFWIDFLAALMSGYCPSYGTFIGRDKWCRIIMVCRVEQASYGQTSNVGQL